MNTVNFHHLFYQTARPRGATRVSDSAGVRSPLIMRVSGRAWWGDAKGRRSGGQKRRVCSPIGIPLADLAVHLSDSGLVRRNHDCRGTQRHTRKLPTILDGDQESPSVHRLMPLSSTQKTNTAPLLIIDRRSESLSRRVILGIIPRRAAMIRRRASVVVST